MFSSAKSVSKSLFNSNKSNVTNAGIWNVTIKLCPFIGQDIVLFAGNMRLIVLSKATHCIDMIAYRHYSKCLPKNEHFTFVLNISSLYVNF